MDDALITNSHILPAVLTDSTGNRASELFPCSLTLSLSSLNSYKTVQTVQDSSSFLQSIYHRYSRSWTLKQSK